MPSPLLEICVTSCDELRGALAIEGVARVELCADLDCGGLTPDIAEFRELPSELRTRTAVMVRPRAGDFCYSRDELRRMCDSAAEFRAAGAEALVVGALRPDCTIDRALLDELSRAAPGRFVFHRAFDRTPDLSDALEELCDSGVVRVLTSGGADDAVTGAAVLARLHAQARGRISILAGGGIRSSNVKSLLAASGIREVHSAARKWENGRYRAIDLDEVRQLSAALRPS